MIVIDDIIISLDVVENHFACHLQKCKGACCYEGDFGAPLEAHEIDIISENLDKIKPYLSEDSINKIQHSGFYTKNENDADQLETALMDDASCVFMGKDELGITFCGIEKAFLSGTLDFKKPISCHLYPIRVNKNKTTGFEALNYDRWDICNSACSNGTQNNIRIYEFVKDGLIRKYGSEFYNELVKASKLLKEK